MRRCGVAIVCAVAWVGYQTGEVTAANCWAPPVAAAVTDPFREPACRWCEGNRGIEYATPAGVNVRAVAAGRVSFAGSVAGTSYVIVRHADGLRATYGNLATRTVATGDAVARGAIVGTTAGRLHFGVRDGERYIDPAPLLGVMRSRPRLVPIDGTPALPAPPPKLVCRRSPTT